MDYSNRTSRPAAAAPRPFDPVVEPANNNDDKRKNDKKGPKFNLAKAGFLFVVVVATVVLLCLMALIFTTKDSGIAEEIQADKYQAVFLNSQDGQVYFGKLTVLNKQYYQLSDIYYVRIDNAIQPDKNEQAKQNISLAKLGSEIHGPQDIMYINKEHVLFWENLKNQKCVGDEEKDKACSQVYTAIVNYKEEQKNAKSN